MVFHHNDSNLNGDNPCGRFYQLCLVFSLGTSSQLPSDNMDRIVVNPPFLSCESLGHASSTVFLSAPSFIFPCLSVPQFCMLLVSISFWRSLPTWPHLSRWHHLWKECFRDSLLKAWLTPTYEGHLSYIDCYWLSHCSIAVKRHHGQSNL